jgi:hypothetical protein
MKWKRALVLSAVAAMHAVLGGCGAGGGTADAGGGGCGQAAPPPAADVPQNSVLRNLRPKATTTVTGQLLTPVNQRPANGATVNNLGDNQATGAQNPGFIVQRPGDAEPDRNLGSYTDPSSGTQLGSPNDLAKERLGTNVFGPDSRPVTSGDGSAGPAGQDFRQTSQTQNPQGQ